jgi:cell division septation protein DedD
MAQLTSSVVSDQRAAAGASTAPAKPDRAQSGEPKIRGFVVYVGAFESSAKAESLAKDLRRRNLAARTSVVEKPGRKPLASVWVGSFDARAGVEAVLPEIRAAGLEETMIRAVP